MTNRVNTRTVQKTEVVVSDRPQKVRMSLPENVKENFAELSSDKGLRNEYIRRIRSAGWTLESIAKATGLTREAVRLITNAESDLDSWQKDIIDRLDVPELPRKVVVKKIRKSLDPDVLAELKELHGKAKLVRFNSPEYREEAEKFTKMVFDQVQNGISTYTIAKELGVTHGAISSRLVRYGYYKTTGESKCFTPIVNREVDLTSASGSGTFSS